MRIFNKIIDSNKEPLNYNDIWFDGTSFRIYKEGEQVLHLIMVKAALQHHQT